MPVPFVPCWRIDRSHLQIAYPERITVVVLSSSVSLRRGIHGQRCNRDHEHQHVEGSVRINNMTMSRYKFTESYPKKFARQVMKILLYDKHEQPVYAETEGNNAEHHPTKRRRLFHKLSPQEIARRYATITWRTVMDNADQLAPRVGARIVDDGEILTMVQQLCPGYTIKHLVLCRGTDRYRGPTKQDPPGTYPWRKRVCIRRRHEDV